MSRQPSTYAVPMTPVTPLWAGGPDLRSAQRQRLLPSALEMTTPPQTVPRKLPNNMAHSSQLSTMPTFPAGAANNMAMPMNMPMGSAPMDTSILSSPQVRPSMHHGLDPMGNVQSPYAMAEYPMGYPTNQSPQAPTQRSQAELAQMMRLPPYSQISYPMDRSYPSMRLSYAQYYPDAVTHQQTNTPSSRVMHYANSGRVSKGNARRSSSQHSAMARTAGVPTPPMKVFQGQMETYQTEIKDRYAAYNHYILRHAAEEKSKVIWSAEVEAAFMEAVWLIPGDSCKILMDRRTRGRNELISDYLHHKLGETRSRKQVSSHLQVLKKLLHDDEEFLEYVGPRKNESSSRDPGQKSDSTKARPDMSAASLAQLITKLKLAKRNQPKPSFLLQAEANLRQSQREEAKLSSQKNAPPDPSITSSSSSSSSASSAGPLAVPMQMQYHQQSPQHLVSQGVMLPSARMPISQMPGQIPLGSQMAASQGSQPASSGYPSAQLPEQQIKAPNSNILSPKKEDSIPNLAMAASSQYVPSSVQDPPLRHPRPVHAQDLGYYAAEPIVTPSASVPPKDAVEAAVSPRKPHHLRHHSRHHRRTTSTSVDLRGDRVLPVQFRMVRATETDQLVYSRLLRATYESPTRPLELQQLTPKFSDLAALEASNELGGSQVIHANVSLYVKGGLPPNDVQASRSQYSSDVQFVVTCDTSSSVQHRYIAKTVVTSRATELLKCEMPCMFHRLAGRGLELDKEVLSVPFLPDFWADFLARLSGSDHEYVQAALSALTMHQAIYRVTNNQEELVFVSLYQFSAAQDEFSARTRFRRVKGVPPAKPAPTVRIAPEPSSLQEPPAGAQSGGPTPAIREPSTPTRSGKSGARVTEQTPKPGSTPALLGIGTPGQAMNSINTFINCESPSLFTSPRRLNPIENIELGASPFTAVISNESRGSPRSSRFEIQRAMTAFEPSAWDEMHDWIYQ